MTILIRKATVDDRDAIVSLMDEMHSESQYANFTINKVKMHSGLNFWIHAKANVAVIFVAETDGRVVGVVAASVMEHWGSDSKFSHQDLYTVSKEYRNKGIGAQLFNEFFSWAKNHVAHVHASAFSGTGAGLDKICQDAGMIRAGSAYVWNAAADA